MNGLLCPCFHPPSVTVVTIQDNTSDSHTESLLLIPPPWYTYYSSLFRRVSAISVPFRTSVPLYLYPNCRFPHNFARFGSGSLQATWKTLGYCISFFTQSQPWESAINPHNYPKYQTLPPTPANFKSNPDFQTFMQVPANQHLLRPFQKLLPHNIPRVPLPPQQVHNSAPWQCPIPTDTTFLTPASTENRLIETQALSITLVFSPHSR